ncbi:class I SAM-dependent rRNA methyltransferase [Candidatus Viridilinea mediisalina]|uniref:23S rRNA (Cytosine(1962)-C(5))-methyltransferase RlmI n=1 Tax=Candidatus Viridilinea mediisalina TaxID=2024553 RepID=A0A2A6RHL2_9CHLR|nr:class I SAM-dependent methyltransferase [Candidatus Viridilinea mediisalina]PDW02369.1 23S rRNA (cytosine(1962)-C(5))-methyltransferase RlmI [Candidatus Viridilinea mediisalina]
MASVTLKPGRERPLQQYHPWVFSGAIGATRDQPGAGAVVEVLDAAGAWLARGFYSSTSQLRVRVATWQHDEALDSAWLRRRLAQAIQARAPLITHATSACRLAFSESDGLPGLIVDRYGSFLVVQLLTQAMAARAHEIIGALVELEEPDGIYERSDAEVRAKEGLPAHEGLLWGATPPAQLRLRPIQLPGTCVEPPPLLVDLCGGQKTGHYLDQAVNRARVAAYSRGARVLDCFCYSGGFSLYAALNRAASLTLIDSAPAALALARANLALIAAPPLIEYEVGNVFQVLRRYRAEHRRFDLIILDPPKFVHNQTQSERAARAYKDINLLALQLLAPGGSLATFSCSGLLSADLFQKIVFGAAVDARREVQIIERLGHAPDHPVRLTFPEGEYLKGFICRVA